MFKRVLLLISSKPGMFWLAGSIIDICAIALILLLMVIFMQTKIWKSLCLLQHEITIRTGISCKKTPCYMRACSFCIVENAKIFCSYIKYFWNLARVINKKSWLVYANKFPSIFQSYFFSETIKRIWCQPSFGNFYEKSMQRFKKLFKKTTKFSLRSVVRSKNESLAVTGLMIKQVF